MFPRTASQQKLAACAWALLCTVVALWLFAEHNDFPFFYHSDESAKAEQVLTRDYNFHHPMLLLTMSEFVLGSGRATADPQRAVEAGRLVSALFSALSVGLLTLLAWARGGWLASIAAGLLLAFHQQLFELAHYMKEDPALLLGVSVTFAALAWFRARHGWAAAVAVGIGCGLASSGKYVGAVMLPLAVAVVWREEKRGRNLALILAAAIAVFTLANVPLLRGLDTFRASLDREVEMVVAGSKGMTRRVPHTAYLSIFRDNTTPIIWLLLAVYYARLWQRRREHDALAWALAIFPLGLMLVFSFSPKTNDRYFLPLTATFYVLAAIGLQTVAARGLGRWKHRWLAPALLLAALACEAPKFADVYRAFKHDDRRALADFIVVNVPREARIAQDERVMLPDARNRRRGRIVRDLPQTIESGDRYAAELGSIEELRAKGFTHVAVTESSYGRFFLEGRVVKDDYREEFERHRLFYERLRGEAERLFERKRSTVIYLHPGLELYRLR